MIWHTDKMLLICNVLCHNCNELIETDTLDICGDETFYFLIGFSESGSIITGYLHNKPSLRKVL